MALSERLPTIYNKIDDLAALTSISEDPVSSLREGVKDLIREDYSSRYQMLMANILVHLYSDDRYQLGLDLTKRALTGKVDITPAKRCDILNALYDYIYEICGGDISSFIRMMKNNHYIRSLPFE